MENGAEETFIDEELLEELKVNVDSERPFNEISKLGVKYYNCSNKAGQKKVIKAGESYLNHDRLEHEFNVWKEITNCLTAENSKNILLALEMTASKSIEGRCYLLTEWFDATVSEVIQKESKIQPQKAKEIFFHLLHSISCLSAQNIVHRNITPDSICITDISSKQPKVLLTDLFFADSSSLNREVVGDQLDYISPVIIHNGSSAEKLEVSSMKLKYGSNVDTWSALVVFYTMLFGQSPFKAVCDLPNKTYIKIWNYYSGKSKAGQFLQIPSTNHGVPSDFIDFLKKHLSLEKMETLSSETLLEDPFFVGVKNDDLKLDKSIITSQFNSSQFNASVLDASLLNFSNLNLSTFGSQAPQKNDSVTFAMQEKLCAYFTKLAECEISKLEFYRKMVEAGQELISCLLDNKPRIIEVYIESIVPAVKLQLQVIGRVRMNRRSDVDLH